MVYEFAQLIHLTKGDVILDYYDILYEGESVDERVVELEQKGLVEAFIEEDNTIRLDDLESRLRGVKIPQVPQKRLQAIADALKANDTDWVEQIKILESMTDDEVVAFAATPLYNDTFYMFDEMYAERLDYALGYIQRENMRFKLKKNEDKRLSDLKQQFNDITELQEQLEQDV